MILAILILCPLFVALLAMGIAKRSVGLLAALLVLTALGLLVGGYLLVGPQTRHVYVDGSYIALDVPQASFFEGHPGHPWHPAPGRPMMIEYSPHRPTAYFAVPGVLVLAALTAAVVAVIAVARRSGRSVLGPLAALAALVVLVPLLFVALRLSRSPRYDHAAEVHPPRHAMDEWKTMSGRRHGEHREPHGMQVGEEIAQRHRELVATYGGAVAAHVQASQAIRQDQPPEMQGARVQHAHRSVQQAIAEVEREYAQAYEQGAKAFVRGLSAMVRPREPVADPAVETTAVLLEQVSPDSNDQPLSPREVSVVGDPPPATAPPAASAAFSYGDSSWQSRGKLTDPIVPADAVAVTDRPSWCDDPGRRDGNTFIVTVHAGPATSVFELEQALDRALTHAAHEYLRDQARIDPWAAATIALSPEYLRERVMKVRHTETTRKDFSPSPGEPGDTVYVQETWAQLEFDPQVRRELEEMGEQVLVERRLVQTGLGAGIVLLVIGSIFGYLKLDTATKGFYTRRLQLSAGATILALLAAGLLLVLG